MGDQWLNMMKFVSDYTRRKSLNCQFEWMRYHWLITLTKSTNHWKIRDFVCSAERRKIWFLVDILFPFSFHLTSMKLNKIYDNISTFFSSHQKYEEHKKNSFNHTGELNAIKHAVEWKHDQYRKVRINDSFFSLWIQLTIVQMKRKITFFLYSHWKKPCAHAKFLMVSEQCIHNTTQLLCKRSLRWYTSEAICPNVQLIGSFENSFSLLSFLALFFSLSPNWPL